MKRSNAGGEFALLYTPLDGKVFETQQRVRAQKEKRKQVQDPQKVLSEDVAAKQAREERKAKAAAKNGGAKKQLQKPRPRVSWLMTCQKTHPKRQRR